jgi:hypothetical protein
MEPADSCSKLEGPVIVAVGRGNGNTNVGRLNRHGTTAFQWRILIELVRFVALLCFYLLQNANYQVLERLVHLKLLENGFVRPLEFCPTCRAVHTEIFELDSKSNWETVVLPTILEVKAAL